MITNDNLDSQKATRKFHGKSQFLNALKDQLFLQDTLHSIKQEVENLSSYANTHPLRQLISDFEKGTMGLGQSITNGLVHDAIYAVPTNESAGCALRVFGTPGLAEMILLELEPRDLLVVEQVNRALRSSIASSPKLQRKLFLNGSEHCFWRTHLKDKAAWNEAVVTCSIQLDASDTLQDEGKACVTATVCVRKDNASGEFQHPEMISRQRLMLICQPPITKMEAMADCCLYRFFGSYLAPRPRVANLPRVLYLESPSGITAGDVLDMAEKLNQAHRNCPFAQYHQHATDGTVHVSTHFSGDLKLRQDDPKLEPISIPTIPPSSTDSETEFSRIPKEPTELGQFITAKHTGM